ncbi:MAG: SRPBCC domain-containing protein [Bacteroidetes bacterium]|nr:SRPBCC domain-containing protein [Bacteroidota bacterium]
MEKMKFTIDINAPREKVWKILWNDETYREWTKAFSEGSHAVSDWNEGSKIHFLDPNGQGMYSTIDRKIPNEFMSFKHIGMIKDGEEQPVDEETKSWSGAMENYKLEEHDGITTLTVENDTSGEDWENMLKEAFPKALKIVKDLSEKEYASHNMESSKRN